MVEVVVLSQIIDRSVLSDLLLEEFGVTTLHVLAFDNDVLNVLVEHEFLAKLLSIVVLDLIVAKVDRVYLLEHTCELCYEFDTILYLYVLHRKVKTSLLPLLHNVHVPVSSRLISSRV